MKKIAMYFLALFIVMTLAACGSNPPSTKVQPTQNSQVYQGILTWTRVTKTTKGTAEIVDNYTLQCLQSDMTGTSLSVPCNFDSSLGLCSFNVLSLNLANAKWTCKTEADTSDSTGESVINSTWSNPISFNMENGLAYSLGTVVEIK